jgi:hypothetical protein
VSFLLFPARPKGEKKRENKMYMFAFLRRILGFLSKASVLFSVRCFAVLILVEDLVEKQEIQTQTVSLFFVFVFFPPGFLLLFEVVLHCFVVAFLVYFVAVIRLLLLCTVVSLGRLFTPSL